MNSESEIDSVEAPPYAELTPDCVFAALDGVGLHGDGRLLALNSYENRVYQIGLAAASGTTSLDASSADIVVAKFYRPRRWSDAAILEEHAFVGELAEREIPVIAPLSLASMPDHSGALSSGNFNGVSAEQRGTLHTFAGFRFAVYPKCAGRSPELDNRNTLQWMGRFIGRIHAVGALRPFTQRPRLDIATFGEEPRLWLLAHEFIPADLLPAWRSVSAQALDGVRRCYERAGSLRLLRLHGDCYASNVLWVETAANSGPHFVDFDDSRMGPAVQDMWMLLSGERDAMSRQLADILAGYEDFFDFDRRELHLIEALRTLRLLHYSAWLARRWDDPAFHHAFPWFNTERYWQDRILELREQIALMDEPPVWPE